MLALLTALALFVLPASAGSAVDRCRVEHCTCEVQENPNAKLANKYSRMEVSFSEDSADLTERDKERIRSYLRQSVGPLYLFGYADQCGDSEYNADLSRRRAVAVRDYIQSISNRVHSVSYYGETASDNHDRHDRRVVISARPDFVTAAMDAVDADVYLIDASGSAVKFWTQYERYDFPPGAEIYVSKMVGCQNGDNISQVRPSGGTEIWYSYYHVLDRMSPGETLLIISDFDSNVPLTAGDYKAIESRAKQNRINVRTVVY